MKVTAKEKISSIIVSALIGTRYHGLNRDSKLDAIDALADVLVDVNLTSDESFKAKLDELGESMTKEAVTIVFRAFDKALVDAGVKEGLRGKIQRKVSSVLNDRDRLNKEV